MSDSNLYKRQPEVVISECKDKFLADQITLRVLYTQGITEESKWVKEHGMESGRLSVLREYIGYAGRSIGLPPNGAKKYSIKGMSVVLDSDCMSTELSEGIRYLILRPDCKLYSLWDDKASLIF